MLTGLVLFGWLAAARAQSGNGLLLPFPSDSVETPAATPSGGTRERDSATTDRERKQEETRRALELAETFIHRQQREVSNSVPMRGTPASRTPVRAPAPSSSAAAAPAIAVHKTEKAASELPGPSTELLPLPADDSPGQPLESLLPDPSAILPSGETPPAATSGDVPENGVPRSDLAPAPAYGDVEVQDRRGPVFRIPGAEAFKIARARGFKFTPAGGIGSRDGTHTGASQFPNVLTSEVHGTRMSQLRPPAAWAVAETSNTFFMFCDANYNAVRLSPGWRIRGIKLEGPNWRWVACPRSGSNTASFSVRVYSYKNQDGPATAIQLAGLTLEGPEGSTDWHDAFPNLTGKALPSATPAAREASPPPATAKTPGGKSEPPLPE
jgi:hypothetical protein